MTIETKYNIGDEVWLMRNNEAALGFVEIIDIRHTTFEEDIEYYVLGNWHFESSLFPTKEELLKSL